MNRPLNGEGLPAHLPPPYFPSNWVPATASLAAGEIHLWTADLDSPTNSPEDLWALLSPDERLRAARYHFARDRRRYLTGRGILRRLLGRTLGLPPATIEFRYGPHGKPALADLQAGDLRFNLAHAEGLAVYAIARQREIGVDVERVRPLKDTETLARRFFSRGEYEALRALPEPSRLAAFFACWTRKEATLKARGDGLALPLDRFEVSVDPARPARLLSVDGSPAEASRWGLHSFTPAPGHIAALAIEGGADWPLTLHAGPPA
jgi:4'-phosphopantetheinyl transferase